MSLVALPTEIVERIDALIDGAIAECPGSETERRELRAQLVSYFCETNRLPEPAELSIRKVKS